MSLLGGETCHSGRSRNDYLVRSLGLLTQALPGSPPRICMRIGAFLTTGTFNLVVKDRSAVPPERRVSAGNPLPDARPRSTTLQTSQNAEENLFTLPRLFAHCQPGEPAGNPEDFDSISPGRSTP